MARTVLTVTSPPRRPSAGQEGAGRVEPEWFDGEGELAVEVARREGPGGDDAAPPGGDPFGPGPAGEVPGGRPSMLPAAPEEGSGNRLARVPCGAEFP